MRYKLTTNVINMIKPSNAIQTVSRKSTAFNLSRTKISTAALFRKSKNTIFYWIQLKKRRPQKALAS